MRVKELIEELIHYNPNAEIEIVKENKPYEVEEVCFFNSNTNEKDCNLVSLWVGKHK